MARILLIEDSVDIGALVTRGLHPHVVQHVHSLLSAERALESSDFDAVLIDVGLPDGNGFDFCAQLSRDSRYKRVIKILLTAYDETADKVHGFNCGADDYVTKPFHPAELYARVDRYLRKIETQNDAVVIFDEFKFDLEFHRCSILDGEQETDLGLTPTEFRLLLTLAKAGGKVQTREQLEKSTWEANGTAIQARGIDTHIAHLRKKLGVRRSVIVSVYGQGYAFASGDSIKAAA
jgi:DNA-binding response OmpR family regulator